MFYRIAEITIDSQVSLPSFKEFAFIPQEAEEDVRADVSLVLSEEEIPQGSEVVSDFIVQRKTEDGWYFHSARADIPGLMVSGDYTKLRIIGHKEYLEIAVSHGMDPVYADAMSSAAVPREEALIRMALECLLSERGYVSLHAACVELDGNAYAFSGPSGTGKSTRANAWTKAFSDAELVSGDRPLIDVKNMEVYGVPWDGKEQCYKNVHYPLKAIFEVRRKETGKAYIRKMTFEQKRKLLMRQCFVPMWDTETAVIQMMNIAKIASSAPIMRAFCGREADDAEALRAVFESNKYKKEETDMKAKEGFVLRTIAGEKILMPTGDNIGKFKGTVLLNEVSAFIWEKMQNPVSRDDLLTAILDEFDVEESVAAADLDALLDQFVELDVIEKD